MLLNEVEAKKMLIEAGINATAAELARSREEAIELSRKIGYPVVLKIVSEEVVHKSDAGGVRLNLMNGEEVGKAYIAIMDSIRTHYPQAKIQGVAVQQMARPGVEVIVGMYQDKQFGPVLMFGLGGVWVEVLKDVSFKLTPLTEKDAADMIKEIKGYQLLKGFRGSEAVDINSLEQIILKVGQLVEKNPQIQEIDLNPILAYREGAIAVDARIILAEKDPREAKQS